MKLNKWEKIALAVLIIAIVIGMILICIFLQNQQDKRVQERLEKQIIELAAEEVDIQGENPTLELIGIEKVGWAKYQCYNYVMTTTTHRYHIGVMRNETEIHFVDVVSVSVRGNNEA